MINAIYCVLSSFFSSTAPHCLVSVNHIASIFSSSLCSINDNNNSNPECPTEVEGTCYNNRCESLSCPVNDRWWNMPGGVLAISIGGGIIVVSACSVMVYCYYRRRRAALQKHLATMYVAFLHCTLVPCLFIMSHVLD
jgi:hypothetical protein